MTSGLLIRRIADSSLLSVSYGCVLCGEPVQIAVTLSELETLIVPICGNCDVLGSEGDLPEDYQRRYAILCAGSFPTDTTVSGPPGEAEGIGRGGMPP